MALTHLFCLQYFLSKNEARFLDFHHPRFHEIHAEGIICFSDQTLPCCRNRLCSRLQSLRSTAIRHAIYYFIILQSFYFIHSITAASWCQLQLAIATNMLEIIDTNYSQSYLCYLDGFSGNYFHSHFNFWFCITCPALRWIYFHNPNQLCQLTFFLNSLTLAISCNR